MKKEILAVIRGIEKFLIFLAPKSFLIRIDCKGILDFVKKNSSNMQVQGQLLHCHLWLNKFSFSIEHIQGSKNSLPDSLTQELTNADYQSRPPARKGGILNEISFLLEQVMPSSKVLIDNWEFHTKSTSCFGLLSTTYFRAQRFSLLRLQVSYLQCPYDI